MLNKCPIKISMIGHVDTGKSTTLGNILYLTNNISNHEMEKTKKEADNNGKKKFCYAYLLDTDNEERTRGITQSHNIINFNYQNQTYQLIDTPGHKLYIREMIDVLCNNNDTIICIVVSCIENEFNASMLGGSTKEDLLLARGCNIKNIIVLINKIDLLEEDKILESYNKVKNKLEPFISKLGFKNINYLPISGYEGWNLVTSNKKINNLIKPKFSTLFDIINNYNLENISKQIENIPERKQKKKIKVQFNVLNIEKIITIGNIFNLHIVDSYKNEDNEINGELLLINTLDNKKKLFINNGDKLYIGIELSKEIYVYNNQRIIFRNNFSTIGFGKIIISN